MNGKVHKFIAKNIKGKVDDFVISSGISKTTQIKFVNNDVATNMVWDSASTNLFIVKDKRIIETTIEKYSKSAMESVIKKALGLLKIVGPNEEYFGIAQGPFKYTKIAKTYDPEIENLGEDSLTIVKNAIDTARAHGAIRSSGVLEFGSGTSLLSTSGNVDAEEKSTSINFSIRSFANKESSGHKVSASCMLDKFDASNAAENAAKLAESSMKPKLIPSGKYDVIFDPLAFADILNRTMSSASAYDVEAGLSFFVNRLGKNVASQIVDIYDDATIPNGIGTTTHDAEGVPTRKNKVIENGNLKTYLHNTSTAKRHNTQTTANAGLISPSPTNIVLEPRENKFEDLVSNVRKGIYVTNQWYTRFQNYQTGDFSTIPRDAIFYIRNGAIQYPVKGIRISDNMINILRSISAIGNDQQQILSWEAEMPTFTPSVLVKNLNITKPK